MKVILLEKVKKLGSMGEVVSVKNGYGRNFLLPNGKAMRATEDNLASFEKQKAQIEKEYLNKKEESTKIASSIKDTKIILVNQAGEDGRLFGSISSKDISDSLKEKGFIINKSSVSIASPIKYLGVYVIELSLHSEVSTTVYVNVARSKEEAVNAMNEYLMKNKSKSSEAKSSKEENVKTESEEEVSE